MKYIFLTVFLISTAIHLYASKKEDTGLRNKSKPFILLSLLAFYVMATEDMSVLIVFALFFSWIGDLLLIHKGIKWFASGGTVFAISHMFFIAGYTRDISFKKIPVILIILLSLIFTGTVVYIFSKLKSHLPKPLFYPAFFYLLLNGAMNCFAILRFASMSTVAAVITALGAILFFVSDTFQFFVRFRRNSKLKTHFPIMLTYSVGELLIVLGLL